MAIIYSYPKNTDIQATDTVVGTTTKMVNGKPKNQTKSFQMGTIANFIAPLITPTLDQVLTNGNTGTGKDIILTLEGDGLYSYGGTLTLFDYTIGNVNNAAQITPYGFFASDNTGQTILSRYSISQGDGSNSTSLIWDTLLSNETITIPNATGTMALTSDIPSVTGFVPYTGATGPVNLGAYNLTVNGLTIGRTNGNIYNSTVLGVSAGLNNTTGDHNTFIGFVAGGYNTSGTDNTALGSQALYLNTTGVSNTAIGKDALYANTTGTQNTAIGRAALNSNTTGFSNTVVGRGAGLYNTTGSANSFLGYLAGSFATDASYNTFIGQAAGYLTTTGGFNTGIGSNSLQFNTSGAYNAALGLSSNRGNTTGVGNATFGAYSAFSNATGSYNSHLGYGTGYYITSGNNNVFLGKYAGRLLGDASTNTISNTSIYIGSNSASYADNQTNQIVIGDSAIGAGSDTVVIGNNSITKTVLKGQIGIGTTAPDASAQVQIDSTTKGFLPPRMTTTEINAIVSPTAGLIVYNTTLQVVCFRDSTGWRKVTHTNM